MSVNVVVQTSDALRKKNAAGTRASALRQSQAAARATIEHAGYDAAELSITWVTDAEITRMNEEYLDHEGVTDVISFELYETGEIPVGDIYIGYEQAARQAKSFGCTNAEELVRLAVHGTLHVLGFDHGDGDKRLGSAMWMFQEAVVSEVFA